MTYDIEARVRRNRRWIIAAAVVALALTGGGIGIGLALSGGSNEGGSRSPDIRWINYHGARLPVSGRHGPSHLKNDRAWGFSHDRMGAVMAATHIAMRTDSTVGPEVFRPTIRRQVTGAFRPVLADTAIRNYKIQRRKANIAPGEPLPATSQAQITGYRVERYSPRSAVVHVLDRGQSSRGPVAADIAVELRWSGPAKSGRWKVVAPSQGQWELEANQVNTSDNYTTFPREG